MVYKIDFSGDAREHLNLYPKRDQVALVEHIERKLLDQPCLEARNRKRLKPNKLATLELRIGAFRVYFDVDVEAQVVIIVAIGKKEHAKVIIAGEEVQL